MAESKTEAAIDCKVGIDIPFCGNAIVTLCSHKLTAPTNYFDNGKYICVGQNDSQI